MEGTRRRRTPVGRILIEIPVAIVLAILVSGVVQAVVGGLDIPVPSNKPAAIAAPVGSLFVLTLIGLAAGFWRRWPIWATVVAYCALAALTTAALALPLEGTQYYLGGISIDQAFRTQYLTRLTDSLWLRDMNYIDTPAYYPGGWFWFGGRFADLMGLAGWEAYKPWSILSLAVTSALTFTFWSLVVRRPIAVLLALASSLVGLGVPATEPYAWTIAALLPPLAVIAYRAFASKSTTHGPLFDGESWQALGLVGLVFGLSGAIYTLYFGFTGLLLALLALTTLLSAARLERWNALRQLVLRLIVIGAIALVPMSLVWAPYAIGVIENGWPSAGAALRYLPEGSAMLPFPMLQTSVMGFVSLIGTIWLVVRFGSDEKAKAMGVLVSTCYLWFALSALALVADTTLLAFRVRVPLETALACAGVLGALDGAHALGRMLRADKQRALIVGGAVLGVIAAASVAQAVPQMHRHDLDLAYNDYYPTGVNAMGEEELNEAGAWYDDLHETILAETGQEPHELVLLTNVHSLLVLHPYWGFQQITAHYANPLADYDSRLDEVARWAAAGGSQDFIARLDSSPYRAPSVFVLDETVEGYRAALTRDAFPKEPNVATYDVIFARSLFADEHFTHHQVGPFAVLIRR